MSVGLLLSFLVTLTLRTNQKTTSNDSVCDEPINIAEIMKQYGDGIEQHVVNVNNEIDSVENGKPNTVHHKTLTEWKTNTISTIQNELFNLIHFRQQLQNSIKNSKDTLNTQQIFEFSQKYAHCIKRTDKSLIIQFLVNDIKLININDDDNNNIILDIDPINSILPDIPFIINKYPINNSLASGYRVNIKWHMDQPSDSIENDYTEHDDNKFDSSLYFTFQCMESREMYNELLYNQDIKWTILEYTEIININEYEMDVIYTFLFNETKYNYIEYIDIYSELSMIKRKIRFNMLKEKELKLKIAEYSGYFHDYYPVNMLQSDDNYWRSQVSFNRNNNDEDDDEDEEDVWEWFIFEIDDEKDDDNVYYYPTKISLRIQLKGDNNKNINSVREFGLLIGDKDTDEWIECHDFIFSAENTQYDYQIFDLGFIDSDKVNQIDTMHWKHFKLEILNNHGGTHVSIQEFKLYGIPQKIT